MIQRKANVIFFKKKYLDTYIPPRLAKGSILTRLVNITTREFRMIQVYNINIILNPEEREWHYWLEQSKNLKITLPKNYWDQIICWDT